MLTVDIIGVSSLLLDINRLVTELNGNASILTLDLVDVVTDVEKGKGKCGTSNCSLLSSSKISMGVNFNQVSFID